MGCLVGIIGFAIGWGLFIAGEGEGLSIFGIAIIIGSFYSFVKIEEVKKKQRENEKLAKSTDEEESLIKELENKGFTVSQVFQDKVKIDRFIVFDENRKMILFVKSDSIKAYNYRDILQSKVLEDGREVLNTSRSDATTGAVIGAALGGGIGAVVGGIVGAKNSSSRESVSVKVVVNDIKEPTFDIELLPRDIEGGEQYVNEQSDTYKNAYKSAQYLHDKVSVLIRQAEELDNMDKSEKLPKDSTTKGVPSIADELRKFADLLADGLITKEEFEKQKKNLMM
ncbi:SHOCT domain-containing protein [Neobacillus niacini]|uniref:SHOCT domain-containing protein n=1 Tax=Neobacillus niacini TaxID=86668 RepID=UPI0030000755